MLDFCIVHRQSLTFFLNCLWIASRASLMVTPLRFRAVTSRPSGKCRSIFLTGGSVSIFLRTSFSSSVAGDLLSRLKIRQHKLNGSSAGKQLSTTRLRGGLVAVKVSGLPIQLLRFRCYLEFLAFLFYSSVSRTSLAKAIGLIKLPRSAMLYTPAALELALRCPLTAPLSSGGEDDKPEIAESTLVRGSTVSADMLLLIDVLN